MAKMQFRHVGIPTNKSLPEEDHSEAFKMTGSGYFESRYGVEWMKFDDDCPMPELIKTVPHVAFVVDYLDAAIADKEVIVAEVIVAPSSPAEGVRVAFIALFELRNLSQ